MAALAIAARSRGRGRWTIMPATYLMSVVILGITVVPLLYVFLDGARSTAQISAD